MAVCKRFFFAGGGTGGHIYPGLAVAEKLCELDPTAEIHFLCSERPIDAQILEKTPHAFTALPAQGLSFSLRGLIGFLRSFGASVKIARAQLTESSVVVGVGGFASSPVCWAAHRLGLPVALINVDIVPGKANKLNVRWAREVFVQFKDCVSFFGRFQAQVRVVGCPLRRAFEKPQAQRARDELQLDPDKKVLLITGASSGCQSINDAIAMLLPKLAAYGDTWQIVHLTGTRNFDEVNQKPKIPNLKSKIVAYYDCMPDLLAAADLLIGRSGAVSVAEYAAAGVPSICIPYPHHKDRHQYRNAGKLVEVGAAIMVDDLPDLQDRAEWLWEELEPLLKDDKARREMSEAGAKLARKDAAQEIAQRLLDMA
jgi:UDP-N-acetylglucosamine--N-acetylmuramyl-(pentapeptide) pyrophosphoryl-undecaprenol N-acetylglucosamine transferase